MQNWKGKENEDSDYSRGLHATQAVTQVILKVILSKCDVLKLGFSWDMAHTQTEDSVHQRHIHKAILAKETYRCDRWCVADGAEKMFFAVKMCHS